MATSKGIYRSARLRELFEYLCRQVLDEGANNIHELEVGHKVFGRPAQYDTIADNIVRVHASMLRKRLNEYFENEGQSEALIIEIPRGNYAPQFIERPPASSRHIAVEAPQFERPGADSVPDVDQPEVAPIPTPSRLPAWVFGTSVLLAVVFCALSLFLFQRVSDLRHSLNSPSTDQPDVDRFWAQVLPSTQPADVVLDDASLDFYQKAAGHSVALENYFDRSYLDGVAENATAAKLDPTVLHGLMLTRESSFANVALTWRIEQIANRLHSPTTLQFARDLTFRQVKVDNVIFLGNPQSNPWIQSFEPRLSVVWVLDPAQHNYYPRDNSAPPAAQDRFRAAGDKNARAGYASISFLPNLSGNANVLILSATGGSAMGMAMDFLVNENMMRQLRSRLPKRPAGNFPYFDLLLKTERGSKDLNTAQVVICRPT